MREEVTEEEKTKSGKVFKVKNTTRKPESKGGRKWRSERKADERKKCKRGEKRGGDELVL